MMKVRKEIVEVGVEGGPLAVARWRGDGPPLLLVHGISASHMAWGQVVEALPDGFDVAAPDLRGRGASGALPGPFGLRRHVEDLCAVIDALFDGGPVHYAGHSMGAYVGVVFAATRPGRLERIVLVDGGLALPLPEGVTPEGLLEKVLGPALARLSREFASRAAYQAFWREHPSFQDPADWNEHVAAYFDYDLVGEPPHLKSRVAEAAVRADGLDPMRDEMVTMIDGVAQPMLMLTAVRGLLNQPEPLMRRTLVQSKAEAMPNLAWREIPDTNHYTITLGRGAAATAAAIAEFLR